jgi:hypothetical protein
MAAEQDEKRGLGRRAGAGGKTPEQFTVGQPREGRRADAPVQVVQDGPVGTLRHAVPSRPFGLQ